MRHLSIITGLIVSVLFQACGGKEPQRKEFEGTWTDPDGATIIISDDGEFTAKALPAEYVLVPKDSFKNQKFDGSGKWTLRKGQAQWEVYLDFNRFSEQKYACSFPLLIAGEEGALENQPPWCLFLWKDEEGGQRDKFLKK